MRKLVFLAGALALFAVHGAKAQNVVVLPGGCGTGAVGTSGASGGNLASTGGNQNSIFVDTTGNLCTNTSGSSATSNVNVAKVNGTTTDTNNGAVSAGTLRVTIANNSTGQVTLASGAQVQQVPGTSGGLSILRKQVANNTTSFAVDASPGQLYGIEAYNNGSTIAYIKLYNAAQGSTTCGSGTPVYQGMIPAPTTGGGGYISMNVQGLAFSTAITACVTTGFADNDTTAPAASTYVINFLYK